VLPVSAAAVLLELKAFGEKFPLEFDLNAAADAEWAAVGLDAAACARLVAERDRQPFASVADFERRGGRTLASLGLAAVPQQ
jgi:hypothetical protein